MTENHKRRFENRIQAKPLDWDGTQPEQSSTAGATKGGNTSDYGSSAELPAILFDGFAVYAELTRHLGKNHCYSPDAVSATLDAVVRLMRKEAAPTTPAQVPAAEVRAQALEEAAQFLEMQTGYTDDEAKTVAIAAKLIRYLKRKNFDSGSLAQSSTADKASEVRAAEDVEYELHQDDMIVAATSGKNAYAEIQHYANQYVQDGPVEVFKVVRTAMERHVIPRSRTADSGNTSALGEGADRG
ncbi:MAG: hypothetical protein ACXU89_09435 [Xanthobacteraceae bacterium]